ncbi:o-succinylbenzoate synthase [Oharaeibacter diazotrophicus]|uniref:o-succinylbenzoate synthase n=1 Tax=Oharaeibacter diazotrophicus TaxID=1920512 RepID=A0A4R6RIF4_9HYPH|nr:o-succinylbenzoate synthase [Oharaeibacter diazotrophicus]TDP86341.1 O-succinylbenzoate synthase [Oharaeibacter diazotrophicus]BBE71716.1 o-succinylbenzoate synthase [Pleomorphomonas sp. SM30]GLS78482.1 o-succinylbenzoate synthase [Oharaeibacter diazotrophicus]
MTRPALRIDGAELRVVRLPLVTPFTISTGTMHEKLFPLLTLRADGLEGYAEGVMDPLPDYLEETLPAALAMLGEVLLPGIVGRAFESPEALEATLASWRGHRMTLAMVEMAFRDLHAKALDLPLKTLLGGSGEAVDVGVSLGIGPIEGTIERVRAHVEQGYKRIKLKIMPGHDVALVEAVRAVFPDVRLSVDANSCYRLADAAMLKRLDRFGLDYIEQPLAYDDIHDHALLQARIDTPICLDESIRTVGHARRALQADATRVVNVKVGRVGGHGEARRIHDLCAAFDVPVWCGGMLESGVGRAHNLHLSTLPNFAKPGDTSSASRYFHRDIVLEKLEAVDGRMAVPQGPGIGVTLDRTFLDTVTVSAEDVLP